MIRRFQLPPHLSPAQRNQQTIKPGDRLVDKTGKTVIFVERRRDYIVTRPIWSN